MKNKILITLFLGFAMTVFSQNITLSGYVRDAKTAESLIGATIYEATQKVGTTTNEYGYYSLTVFGADTIALVISFIGYQAQAKKVFSKENLRLDIALADNTAILNEVVVNASRNNDNVQRAQMSVIDVPMRAIMTLPAIGGERDILKILQLLPGVQSGQEDQLPRSDTSDISAPMRRCCCCRKHSSSGGTSTPTLARCGQCRVRQ